MTDLIELPGSSASRRDEFASTLVHELRGPLQPIILALDIMRQRDPNLPPDGRAVQLLERGVRRLTDTIDTMFELYRSEKGKVRLHLRWLGLDAVIAAAVELTAPLLEERGHRLTVRVDPRARAVRADEARLVQVLTNLLLNAAQYTPAGGAIDLTAEPGDGDEVVIRVRDTGVGIDQDLLPHVFDRFTQADATRGGLGIGLAVARRFVELHGGTISAVSDGPGRGSTFIVRLPQVAPNGDWRGADGI